MIRAGNSNREMAAALGVNIPLLFALVFACGMALAAFAGAIAAPITSVAPAMGNQVLILCFVVVVIGGIGSINGALIASLLIGLADTLGKVLAPEYSGVADLSFDGGDSPVAARRGWPTDRKLAVTHSSLPRWFLLSVVLAVRLVPLGATTYYLQLGAKIMIMAIFALSLDLLIGHTGLVSFGHSAYFGVAAYALALITPKYEAASFWLTLPAAMTAAAFAALVIGFLVVRTAGIYFIMVTLAFAQMLYAIFHDTKLGGGSDGIYINVRPELTVAGFKPTRSRKSGAVFLFRADRIDRRLLDFE